VVQWLSVGPDSGVEAEEVRGPGSSSGVGIVSPLVLLGSVGTFLGVRGVLCVGLGTRSELPGRNSVMSRAVLLDAAGRKVVELRAGPNDVRHLAPGVYFVIEQSALSIQGLTHRT